MRTLLVAWTLLAAGLAGCIGAAPGSVPNAAGGIDDAAATDAGPYEIREPEVVWVKASDGTRIHNVVYRPDTNASVPVFVNFSPYWGDTADERGDAFASYMIERYVPKGYAVVLSAIRGTGHSEGCFRIAGDRELKDLHEVVDHFAGAAWSSGKVAAGGKSYDSTPQNGLVAKYPHPALEGLFHVSGISDMYRYTYRQGVPYWHGAAFNTYYYLQGTDEYGASIVGAGDPADEDADSLARLIDDAACPELPEMQASGVGSALHGTKTGYWQERDWNRYIGDSSWNGSVFFVHGLQDWNVKPDHILPWLDELPDDVRVKGWLHQDCSGHDCATGTGHVYPMRQDWNETMDRWMAETLKGRDTGLTYDVEVESTDDVWRRADTWPPASVEHREVAVDVPDGEATVIAAGEEPVRLAGRPAVRVTATSASPDPVLTGMLVEVGPDGEREWTNEAVLRGVHRSGLDEPDPVPVGEPVAYELVAYPQDDVIEAGHELVVDLGAEPRHAEPWPGQMQAVDYAGQATVVLPLAPMGTALADQPVDGPCFAC